ncbi:MAG TPA: hypothetical protein VHX39_23565 [Acetobacteraceae bacterium]|jgi:hypothetical protein|nr:hypothetical protein [Acetobacteraceae bacterium]
MAYLPVLWDHARSEILSEGDQDGCIGRVWIGYDSIFPVDYHLLVEMHPTNQGMEFVFALLKGDRMTQTSEAIFDSAVANQIIPRWHRPRIRELLDSMTEKVVRNCDRNAFFMAAYCAQLPEPALAKYAMLCEAFRRCGYDCLRSEPSPGKLLWQMNR